jgi:hypothetical protein
MTNFWDDPTVNPLGLKSVGNPDPHGSPEIKVVLAARSLAFFQDAQGNLYACAVVGDQKRAFISGECGYEQVGDQSVVFTLLRMTDEIIAAQRDSR